jgi:hypothetical protein
MTALTNAQRAAVRRLIASSPDWPAYRRLHGVDTSSLGSARAVDVARELGLDLTSILAGETGTTTESTAMPAPTAPAGLFGPVGRSGLFARDAAAPALTVDTAAAAGTAAAGDVGAALATLAAAFGGAGNMQPALDAISGRLDALESAAPRLLVVDAAGTALGADLPPSRHPMLETLIRTVSARKPDGSRLNVWLAGPAGSGKTTAARMTAEALGLAFGPMGAMAQAHELVGFVDAGGRYHDTPFTRLYRDGGVCLLDEVDSSDAAVTLALNGPLDNGLMTLPTGETIARHADFVCIGAGNTYGSGATAEYIGRNKLDGAFLDRFVSLAWGYDEALETALTGNEAWSRRVQKARRAAAKFGLKILITPRASINGAALLRAGLDEETVAGMTYLRGLNAAQIDQLMGGAA